MINICVTCSSSRIVPSTINLIRDRNPDYRFIGIDISEDYLNRSYLDKFYKIQKPVEEDYIKNLLNIVKKESIDFILVLSDEEAFVLTENKIRRELSSLGCEILLPNHELIRICNDKGLLMNEFKKYEFLDEKFFFVNNSNDLNKCIDLFDYPNQSFILKPRIGRGSRGVILVDESGDICEYFLGKNKNKIPLSALEENFYKKNNLNLIATPYYSAKDYNIDVMAFKGEVCYSLMQERIQPSFGPILTAEIVLDKDIYDLVSKVIKVLNVTGLINIEIARRGFDNVPKIYEINPRPSAAFAFLYYQQADPINDLIKCAKNEKPLSKRFIKMNIKRFWDQYYSND